MDVKKLKKLLSDNEGTKLDFKLRLELEFESGKKELAKDVCAIANSKGGRGYIVVGVQDKTKALIGIDENCLITEEQLQQIISSRIEPPIPITVDNIIVDGKKIAVVTVYDGYQKPYQLRENGAFYIRRGSTTDTMRKQELVSAFQENLNLNVETCPILRSTVACLNKSIVDKYFLSKGININDENREFLMESSSIIVKEKESYEHVVSLGGLLVFSDVNFEYIPHNMVRIVNNINGNFEHIISIQGNLINIMEKSAEMVKKILPAFYPSFAVIEGIKNAILHRDYTAFYKEVEVVINKKSVSVESPGNLLKGRNNPMKSVEYFRRNMWIYEKIITLDDKKFMQEKTGFSIMSKAFNKYGKVRLINSYENSSFKVIYPGIECFK